MDQRDEMLPSAVLYACTLHLFVFFPMLLVPGAEIGSLFINDAELINYIKIK